MQGGRWKEAAVVRTARLPSSKRQDWDWQRQAACLGMDSEVFFPPESERPAARARRVQKAVAVCARCLVREACRRWARTAQEPYGVWGGEDQQIRRQKLGQAQTGR